MGGTKKLLEVLDDSYGTDSSVYYRFANADLPPEAVRALDPETAIAKLDALVAEVQGARRSCSYEDVRKKYIALHKLLNERNYIAPRFRPTLHSSKRRGIERKPSDNLISNDHQVLDLHWLSLEGVLSYEELPPRWHGMFKDGLDYELASYFAGTAGSAENKAMILVLTVDQQLALRSLQTEAVRKWWDRQRLIRDQVRVAVQCEARRNSGLRGKHVLWANGWLATRCADYAGSSAVSWYERITGERIAASTLSHIKSRVPKLPEFRHTVLREEA